MSYMFNVEVEGKANAVFDTADEAVRYAMHHVYLQAHEFQSAVDTLNTGQVFMYSYGFTGVNIVPVAKRKESATGLAMYQSVLADNESLRQQLAEKDAEIELERTARQQIEKLLHRQAETIAASQLREQQLREALTDLYYEFERTREWGCLPMSMVRARASITLPADTSALEAMIAKAGEVMREWTILAVAGNREWANNSAQIRALPGVTLEDIK